MKRANDPIFWSSFGAGGMLSALFGPVLIFITGIAVPLDQESEFRRRELPKGVSFQLQLDSQVVVIKPIDRNLSTDQAPPAPQVAIAASQAFQACSPVARLYTPVTSTTPYRNTPTAVSSRSVYTM